MFSLARDLRFTKASSSQEALELCKSIAGKPLALLIADHETVEAAVTDQILASCGKHPDATSFLPEP